MVHVLYVKFAVSLTNNNKHPNKAQQHMFFIATTSRFWEKGRGCNLNLENWFKIFAWSTSAIDVEDMNLTSFPNATPRNKQDRADISPQAWS